MEHCSPCRWYIGVQGADVGQRSCFGAELPLPLVLGLWLVLFLLLLLRTRALYCVQSSSRLPLTAPLPPLSAVVHVCPCATAVSN